MAQQLQGISSPPKAGQLQPRSGYAADGSVGERLAATERVRSSRKPLTAKIICRDRVSDAACRQPSRRPFSLSSVLVVNERPKQMFRPGRLQEIKCCATSFAS